MAFLLFESVCRVFQYQAAVVGSVQTKGLTPGSRRLERVYGLEPGRRSRRYEGKDSFGVPLCRAAR